MFNISLCVGATSSIFIHIKGNPFLKIMDIGGLKWLKHSGCQKVWNYHKLEISDSSHIWLFSSLGCWIDARCFSYMIDSKKKKKSQKKSLRLEKLRFVCLMWNVTVSLGRWASDGDGDECKSAAEFPTPACVEEVQKTKRIEKRAWAETSH